MNFLRHPIYTMLAIALGSWLALSNVRGNSLWHSYGPPRWLYAVRSGFSHK